MTTTQFAAAGSQRYLQIAVNLHAAAFNNVLAQAIGLDTPDTIVWRSPLRSDGLKEYRDARALKALELQTALKVPLADFWPARGPVWDALATASQRRVILVEAKAHIPELASPATKAAGDSLRLIEASLERVRNELAPRSKHPWTSVFYQYTNRLAFLYWLRVLNGKRAELVNVYFTNATDVDGPRSASEWQGALKLMKAQLGITNSRHPLLRHAHDVFIDASQLPDPEARGLSLLR